MINHVSLQGRFTKDPELNHSSNNISYVRFTIAWSEKLKTVENKCFLNCIAFNKHAEFVCNYFKKGDMAIVEGKLITNCYEELTGTKKYSTELKLDGIHFCSSNKKQGSQQNIDEDDSLLF